MLCTPAQNCSNFPRGCKLDYIQQHVQDLKSIIAGLNREANKTTCSVAAWIIKSSQDGELPLARADKSSFEWFHSQPFNLFLWKTHEMQKPLWKASNYSGIFFICLSLGDKCKNPADATITQRAARWRSQGQLGLTFNRAAGVILSGSRQGG